MKNQLHLWAWGRNFINGLRTYRGVNFTKLLLSLKRWVRSPLKTWKKNSDRIWRTERKLWKNIYLRDVAWKIRKVCTDNQLKHVVSADVNVWKLFENYSQLDLIMTLIQLMKKHFGKSQRNYNFTYLAFNVHCCFISGQNHVLRSVTGCPGGWLAINWLINWFNG